MDTSKFNLLPERILSIPDKRIAYISAIGTSGYATAAKGYIYNHVKNKDYVQWLQYDIASTTPLNENTNFDLYISKSKKVILSTPSTIIVHSIPLVWNELISNSKFNITDKTQIIGRTVWEFEKVHPDWIDSINNSVVTHVSVPTEWNKNIFLKAGIFKPIIVEPHIFVDFQNQLYTIEHLLKKSVVLIKSDIKLLNIKDYYKFYCIEQLTDRKNLIATLHAYCKAFKSTDKVALFLKTFRSNYSIQEQVECAKYLNELSAQYPDHAPIVYIKEQLNHDEVHSMHYHFDCYVSLTHTEGFGLSIYDAYKHNKNLIVTGYGGHVEYLGENYSGLVRYNTSPVNSYITQKHYLNEDYVWANADENHAIELMQNAYQNGMESEKYCVSNFTLNNNSIPIQIQNSNVKLLNLPYDANNFYFNPAIFKFNNNKYLMTRYCHIDEDKIPHNTLKLFNLNEGIKEIPLKIKDEVQDEQYEDPRVLIHQNKIYVGCANYQLHVSEKIHQKILVFDSAFNHIENIHPVYDGNSSNCLSNTRSQKNWTYFVHDDKILCVYQMHPHTVIEFDNTGRILTEYKTFVDITKTWRFGEPRMGSNPILKDGIYYNFFHSSVPWKNPKRQYFMGYYTFEAKPPFKIIEISKEPIIWGNESDFRFLPNFNPIVVFPCGAIYEDNSFYVSFGFNDEKTGIIKL